METEHFHLQQHFQIAKILKGHRDDLLRLSTTVYGHYPLNSKVVKNIRKARQAHENLISALEDAMLCENPSLSNAALSVYYGLTPGERQGRDINGEMVSRIRQELQIAGSGEELHRALIKAVNSEGIGEVKEAVCTML